MDKLIARTTVSPNFFSESLFPVRFPSLHVSELPLSGIIRIQGSSESRAFRSGVASTLGVQLPAPERVSGGGDVKLAWAGPHEYLCFCSLENEEKCKSMLEEALAGEFATVTVVSDSRVAFFVAAEDAPALVAKGCSIDMHPSGFAAGHVVTTRFAGLPAMLVHRNVSEYVLYFDVAYTEFIVKWLMDAAEEFAEHAA
ncbi:sarcosine oxidase subunit gamma [Paraburkholderia phenazinium]|uniref:Sarcosine oxidase subunit gamma n=1 Tax=Paraburkholderia phenazinium TaxID=60549 RepID=A0A1N6I813_9BURK|nr:sarcosine oxidase subunit gamma family protein [Paraburkholderia phenazinium]SIO28164.1 sarcosine oxidase subunit gamma [Paraburkholderia phenazinium]